MRPGTWLALGVGDAVVTLASAGLEGCHWRNGVVVSRGRARGCVTWPAISLS